MKNINRIISFIIVCAMLATALLSAVSCGDGTGDAETSGTDTTASDVAAGELGTYVVEVTSAGGMALPGVYVYVYADATNADLKGYAETNEYGKATFELPKSSTYSVVVSGAPKGYEIKESYSFDGNIARVSLTSSLITDESLTTATLGLGDVMYDFTVTTSDGEELTLSDILAEKKMVMLNFWYSTCGPCVSEFPYVEEAYQLYKDDIEIIALNHIDNETTIKSFKSEHGLTFPVASCSAAYATTFSLTGYPTTIMIDRYGVICLVEAGAITSTRPFTSSFEHFISADYKQQLCTSIGDLVETVKPNVEMPASDEIAGAIGDGAASITYRPETDEESAEYSWPFIITEKNGETCIKASNTEIEDSYAIIYADAVLKAGQAVGFDYLVSSELYSDVLFVIVNGEDVYQISGVSEDEAWTSCYPCVADKDGTYEIALCYLKDGTNNSGDDTVYIKNMRVIDSDDIDTATYLPRYAASTEDGINYDYADVVYNEADGYYHVGDENGPLLLADLMNTTVFSEDNSVYLMAYDGEITVDGKNYYDDILPYCTMASNSALSGVCTVSYELAELLKVVASVAGFDGTEDEWLKICKYYESYGTDGVQLVDPIMGLSASSAYKATLGVDVETNYFYYDRVILPRGLWAEFIPEKSGVYRITSHNESVDGVEAWIFDENRNELLIYTADERMYYDENDVSMVFYMEAGKPYYIDIAFWDLYEVGVITYDIEYVASEYDLFRLCSPGYFTYDSDATGDDIYQIIDGGIDVIFGDDGYYYEDLGKDASGKQRYGSLIYCDFTGLTPVFNTPIVDSVVYDENGNIKLDANGDPVKVTGMVNKGGFDFSKTEDDLFILSVMDDHDGDAVAIVDYLKSYWGEDYEANFELYMVEDVLDGIYHGEGEDLSDVIRKYEKKISDDAKHPERQGCVPVTEELAEVLSLLMDKYTFTGVENSWLKLCYYYDHLGPDA